MVVSSGIAAVVTYYAVKSNIQGVIEQRSMRVQQGISKRLETFDALLQQNEKVLDTHIKTVLPQIAQQLIEQKGTLNEWTTTALGQLATQYNVDEIYIIDNTTTVFASSFKADLGFELGTVSAGMRQFLQGLLLSKTDAVVVGRVNVSINSGLLNKYAYYSPAGSDYIFEVSVALKPYLEDKFSAEYVKFIFGELFTGIIGEQLLLKSVDLFLVNDLQVFPFVGDVKPIPRSDLPSIPLSGSVKRYQDEYIEYFSRVKLNGALFENDAYFLAIRMRFDNTVGNTLILNLLQSNVIILVLSLVFIYGAIRFVIIKKIVRRVTAVNDALAKISTGDYSSVCETSGDDGIADISKHVNNMRQRLSKRDSQLKHAYDTLESKVLQRTESLHTEVLKRKQAEQELSVLATTDALTKLPNRRLVDQYVERAIISSQRSDESFAVLFLDVDDFKYVNDSMGHNIGDALLKTIAFRISNAIRSSDVAGRFGGDEFVVLLQNLKGRPELVAQHVQTIVEQILSSIREPLLLDGHDFHCTLSVGVALSDEYSTVEVLYKQADTAMYRAKELGKNNFCFYDDGMQQAADERVLIEESMRKALKDNEFSLSYQAQLNEASQLIGAEALIRWQQDDGVFQTSETFIPIAEELGFIVEMGDWVLTEVCLQLLEWQKQGLDIPHISINISTKQLQQMNFVEHVSRVVKSHSLQTSSICFEIREAATLGLNEGTIKVVRCLREAGFHVSIDDFGTSYSSFDYFKSLPIDQLKIDKCYVQGIGGSHRDTTIVDLIISITKHLGVNVIAEGVETRQQFEYLKKQGCQQFQGFYFSKPLESDEFCEYIKGLAELSDD